MSKLKHSFVKKDVASSNKFKRKEKTFTIFVLIKPTREQFLLNHVSNKMTVIELKSELEFTTGIPASIQRLSYLDEGDLLDPAEVGSCQIVPGGTLQMTVWTMYLTLLEAVVANDIDWVYSLGVTPSADYHTPGSDYMTEEERTEWLNDRAFIALCLAAHRGHEQLLVKLIETGTDVNQQTSTGKTPLHLAAAVGNGKMVDTLLHHGSDLKIEDESGNTALSVADKFGHRTCARHIFQFQWQQRAKSMKPSTNIPLLAHQCVDSNNPVWKRGPQAQIYVPNILKPGEYEGTALHAPKHGQHPSLVRKQLRNMNLNTELSASTQGTQDLVSQKTTNKRTGHMILKRPPTYQEWLKKHQNRPNVKKPEKINTQQEAEVKEENPVEYNVGPEVEEQVTEVLTGYTASSPTPNPIVDDRNNFPVHHAGAFRVYLRSLGRSKSGISYEDWLNEKEEEVNALVKQRQKTDR